MRTVLKEALRHQRLTSTGVSIAQTPKVEEGGEPYTVEEVQHLLAEARQASQHRAVVIALALGLRQGEDLDM
ncbi:hypothetical protein [Streptomyces griseofuscus]|uniref:hypothetical protein n=1 Tax=Streptomyces griseofuscus TaxID=146922 RepID=UPI003452AD53